MVDPISSEFVGRFGISYKDGEIIYAYDEITHGIYQLSLDFKEVTIVLPSMSIHQNMGERIIGISKYGSVIILIPLFLNSKWIFFDLEKKIIKYYSPIKAKIRISAVITLGTNLFLIPACTCSPIIIFSIENMKRIKTYDKWYIPKIDTMNNQSFIWGAFLCGKSVVFPIIDTNQICYFDIERINIITLNIMCSIASVSVAEDKIWVLPKLGECIYKVNLNGEVIDKIKMTESKFGMSENNFNKIIALEEIVFLLPTYGNIIYAYLKRENRFVKIEPKEDPLWGGIFLCNVTPYWDFIVKKKKIYLLPSNYRCKCIDLNSLDCTNYSLKYGNNFDKDLYWEMIGYIQKYNILNEKDLYDFISIIYYLREINFVHKNEKIGEKIWGSFMKK